MSTLAPSTRETMHDDLLAALRGVLDGERDVIANTANAASVMFQILPDLNWAGFYFARGETLVLGPFQGRPACVRIPFGQGVCGTAAARRASVLVPDVHDFPGHIACDAASRSELVVPLLQDGRVLGVIDLDSPQPARFTPADQAAIEQAAALLVAGSDFDRR